MSDSVYCYPPDYTVLKNKQALRDPGQLDRFERRAVVTRITEGVPRGDFDLRHLRAIHYQLFQDVYEWAGELRTVEIAKDGSPFQFRRYIETGMSDVSKRLCEATFLRGLSPEAFAGAAGAIIGDVNYVHPFREGNGRTQALYLQQLARQAGHDLDLRRLNRDSWMDASRAAHQGDYAKMSAVILVAIREG